MVSSLKKMTAKESSRVDKRIDAIIKTFLVRRLMADVLALSPKSRYEEGFIWMRMSFDFFEKRSTCCAQVLAELWLCFSPNFRFNFQLQEIAIFIAQHYSLRPGSISIFLPGKSIPPKLAKKHKHD